MSHTWKFLPLAALAALGAFMLFTGTDAGKTQTTSASDPNIIIDVDSNPEGGIDYEFTFDVNVTAGDEECEDDWDGVTEEYDDDAVIEIDCDDADNVDIEISIEVPNHSELDEITCELTDDGDTDDQQSDDPVIDDGDEDQGSITFEDLQDAEHFACDVVFIFDEEKVTPAATNTTTVGPAATIVVTSSNNNLGCGATSIVTITVRGANGQPVASGTQVNIAADRGSVSPASGVTTADGSVFVFYTSPNNQGGEATITAASGSALGSTEIDIDCNTAPTQAPPPTSDVGGIQPPNTGDGGLSTGNSWNAYAGVALILSSVIGTLAVIRPRA